MNFENNTSIPLRRFHQAPTESMLDGMRMFNLPPNGKTQLKTVVFSKGTTHRFNNNIIKSIGPPNL